jgi:hypothetical protein
MTMTNRLETVQCPGPLKSVLEKALDEVARGNPEEGERLLELALLKDADSGILISQLVKSLADLLAEIDLEIEQRKHSGNDEVWEALQRIADEARTVIDQASGGAS